MIVVVLLLPPYMARISCGIHMAKIEKSEINSCPHCNGVNSGPTNAELVYRLDSRVAQPELYASPEGSIVVSIPQP